MDLRLASFNSARDRLSSLAQLALLKIFRKILILLRQRKRHGKTETHSGSTTFLQPRFGTVGLLGVSKYEEDVERSTFSSRCRSPGSHAQMDTQPTIIFLHGRNDETDRMIEQMSSC
ncbi:hypothetical protein TNCV_1919651 [Trichonephila clavipes]|nr:hypothetical protein TNCV_1919651 [Trichonephila clavipes]